MDVIVWLYKHEARTITDSAAIVGRWPLFLVLALQKKPIKRGGAISRFGLRFCSQRGADHVMNVDSLAPFSTDQSSSCSRVSQAL